MKKTVLVTLSLISLVVLSLAFTKEDPPKYKNLQILPKDISERDLDSIMHHFNVSLGVKCGFCHARNEGDKKLDFASDAKSDKKEARKMMVMANAINDKYFKDESQGNNKQNIPTITCYSCHHGEQIPVGVPLNVPTLHRDVITDGTNLIRDTTKR